MWGQEAMFLVNSRSTDLPSSLLEGGGVDRGRVLFKGGEGNWLILILTEYILLDGYIRVFID